MAVSIEDIKKLREAEEKTTGINPDDPEYERKYNALIINPTIAGTAKVSNKRGIGSCPIPNMFRLLTFISP